MMEKTNKNWDKSFESAVVTDSPQLSFDLWHHWVSHVEFFLFFLFQMLPQLLLVKLRFLLMLPSPIQTVLILYPFPITYRTRLLMACLNTRLRWQLIHWFIYDKIPVLEDRLSINWLELFIQPLERLIIIWNPFVLIVILVCPHNCPQQIVFPFKSLLNSYLLWFCNVIFGEFILPEKGCVGY